MPYTLKKTQKKATIVNYLAREYAKEFEEASNEYIEKLEKLVNKFIVTLGSIKPNSGHEIMVIDNEIFELQTDLALSKKYIEMVCKVRKGVDTLP